MRERRIDVGGARLWVGSHQASHQIGADPALPVLLCSGGPGCCDYLEPVAQMLDGLAEVWRFEQRGCGRSDAVAPYDVETCLSDLETVRDALGFERWVIGGHSWGANLALAHALDRPERVRGILYLAGSGLQHDRSWSEAYHRGLEERGEREPDYLYPPNMEVNREGNSSWRSFIQRADLWRQVGALEVPTLIVVAGRDIRPDWPARQLAAALPHARLAVIEEAEHAIWLAGDEAAASLRGRLRDFLSDLC